MEIYDSSDVCRLLFNANNDFGKIDDILSNTIFSVNDIKYNQLPYLLYCVALGRYRVVEHLVLKYNVDVNCTDVNGVTPLMICAWKNFPNIAGFLIDNNADVNKVDLKQNKTALMIACDHGHLRMVKLFMKYGADMNIKTFDDITCLDLIEEKDYEIKEYFDSIKQ